MEQELKNHLRDNVKLFLDIDNQIQTLQEAIKERKKKKNNYLIKF